MENEQMMFKGYLFHDVATRKPRMMVLCESCGILFGPGCKGEEQHTFHADRVQWFRYNKRWHEGEPLFRSENHVLALMVGSSEEKEMIVWTNCCCPLSKDCSFLGTQLFLLKEL